MPKKIYVPQYCEKCGMEQRLVQEVGYTLGELMTKFDYLKSSKQVEVLESALAEMEHYNGNGRSYCIAIAMGYGPMTSGSGNTEYWVKLKE